MKILVTGGNGKLGQHLLPELRAHGHEVVYVDQRPPDAGRFSDPSFREADVSDVGEVAGALPGCDAVVHLAAIPGPGCHPDERVFASNALGTFAVLQAAALVGVRRAVVASSVSALGHAFAPEPCYPLYAPVDELHPLMPRDPYALGKEVVERTCEMFHRRNGLSVAALRLHHVAGVEEAREMVRRFADDPEGWMRVLWGYVDARDAAAACRLAAEAPELGFEVFNVTAADTVSETPTRELIERFCPELELREPLEGTASAWSTEKARRLLGWVPRHSWRVERRTT